MLGLSFTTNRHHLADVTGTIPEIYNRIISPATNRTNVLCQHRKLPIRFILVYLRSTFAYSKGQTWLCTAALTTNVKQLPESSKLCFKYLNMNKEYIMIMTVILRNGDHSTFL